MQDKVSKQIDWITFSIYIALVLTGWCMVYAVGHDGGYHMGWTKFLLQTDPGKQIIFIAVSAVVFLFTQIIDWKFWRTFAYVIYLLSMLLLALVLIVGTTIKGATSWFGFGGFSLQPSEFAKFGAALGIASYLSNYSTNLRLRQPQAISVGLMLVPMVLILLQPDAGSALVFLALLLPMYREGFPETPFIVGFALIVVLVLGIKFPIITVVTWLCIMGSISLAVSLLQQSWWFLISTLPMIVIAYFAESWQISVEAMIVSIIVFLSMAVFTYLGKSTRYVYIAMSSIAVSTMLAYGANYMFYNLMRPHQQDRINVWLNPEKCDPQGSLYNLEQSKMAIAGGGFWGKGFLKGEITRGNYVPEQSTDFIFCTVGEEQGFIGTVAVLFLFMGLLYRFSVIAERQRIQFVRIYAYALAGIFFIHIFINLAMTMGLMPIIGIPLPFISKGGSSMIAFSLMVGVLLKLDQARTTG